MKMILIEYFFNSTQSLKTLNSSSIIYSISHHPSKHIGQICISVPLTKMATHSTLFLHTCELYTELQTDHFCTIPLDIKVLVDGLEKQKYSKCL